MTPHLVRKSPGSAGKQIRLALPTSTKYVIKTLSKGNRARTPSQHKAIRMPLQPDTGANMSATDNLAVIHDYTPYDTPSDVGVFSTSDDSLSSVLQAFGEGYMKILSDQGTTMRWHTLYTPDSTGTVLSLDNYQRSHNYSKFQQEGQLDDMGAVKFMDLHNTVIESLQTVRTPNGEWYTPNKILLHNGTENEHIAKEVNNYRTQIHRVQCATINKLTQQSQPPPQSKSWTSGLSTIINNGGLTTKMKNLELWHQRYGHISPSTLNKTQKVVDGIPQLPSSAPFFKCPFCEKSKMTKYHGCKRDPKEKFIAGQSFHMDLSFVSGPSNLQEVLHQNAKATTNLKKSRNGHIGFLTIIDAATRYLWTIPLKSKEPPIKIIDRFLTKHGIRNSDPAKAIITTTNNGYLAHSRAFANTLRDHTYKLQPEDRSYFVDLSPDYLDCTVMTDGGGELANSGQFRTTVGNHGYDTISTAADASSQNGMAERPHRTLKERIRCLLYAAGLGTEYWTDALLHATWLYNRTYHSALQLTPMQVYTGRVPLMDNLVTFGSKITAKKPGTRPTTTNPWTYDGIFLGYGASQDNIKYFDIHTGTDKTARHDSKDELQYGDDPTNRSPAASHLLSVFTEDDHTNHSTSREPEKLTFDIKDPRQANPENIVEQILKDYKLIS